MARGSRFVFRAALSALAWAGLAYGGRAVGAGEAVKEVRVRENVRTSSETVQAIAGIKAGAPVSPAMMGTLQARLLESRLFSEAHAFWEPTDGGARVTLVAHDRAPWAPLPMAAYYPGSLTGGVGLVHRNVLDADIEVKAQARLSTVDSGAELGIAAPRLWSGWLRPWFSGELRQQELAEYGNAGGAPPGPLRVTDVRSFAAGAGLHVHWLRRYVTGLAYRAETTRVLSSVPNTEDPAVPSGLPPAAAGGVRAALAVRLGYDDRAAEGPLRIGDALLGDVSYASPRFGGDRGFEDARLELTYERGRRVLKRHNFVARGGAVLTWNAPLWTEAWLGGFNLRGVRHRRYAGDSQIGVQLEHHVPILSAAPFLLRGLVFADGGAIFWGRLPDRDLTRSVYDARPDGRQFLPAAYLDDGFSARRDLHASIGAGLRLHLDPLTVPLLGLDVAYAFRDRAVAVLVTMGR